MRKTILLFALLCASVMTWATINWDAVDYLGSTEASISMNTYKYAVDPDDSEEAPSSIANIQPASGESRLGFYSTYGQGVASCSHDAKILGDQVWLYVDQLTEKDTKITVTLADASTRAFHLYYKNGGAIDPSAPHASGKGFGTYVAKNVSFFPRVDNKADDTQAAYGTVDLFIVTYGNKMMAKAKLNDSKTFNGAGYSMQFRIWNDAQENFGEYWAQLHEDNNTVAVIDMSSNYCNLNQGTRTELPINTYMETNAGTGAVPMFIYTLDYINTPIVGDETAPIISNAAASYNPLDNNPTITITATDANDMFYKVVAPDNSISYSFSNVLNLTTDGSNDILTYHCYAIDFNGNISDVADVNVQMKPALSNIAQGKAVSAGVNSSTAGRIVDGNFNGDRWSSAGAVHYATDPDNYQDWFYINFVNVYDLSAVRIKWETARPDNYTFRTSIDGATWTVVETFTEYPAANTNVDYILPANTQGRYFGVWATSGYDNLNYGMSPFEVEVYGSQAQLDDHNPPTLTSAALSGDAEWNQVHLAVVGTDPEDGSVVSFHVVDATNSIDQVCVATAGIITVTGLSGETEYNLSVTALDNAGNESASAIVVNVTTPIDNTVPLVAAPTPDGTGKDVLPIYSDAFPSILAHSFDKDGFAGVTLMEEKNIGGDNCLVYNVASANEVTWGMYDNGTNAIIAADGYHSATGQGVDASAMTNLHLDIWSLQPCTNAINICINDAPLTSLRLSHDGQGWNSYDIALSDFNEGDEGKRIDNVRWFKFNGIGPISGKMALDNVYFWAPASGIKAVSASSNNSTMGTAIVKQGDDEVNSVAENSSVTFIATPNESFVFVNWTKGGVEVSSDATYVTTITENTNLVANFDYIRETYCHTAVQTSGKKKIYLTVGKGATDGTYQVKIYGSDELTITGINLANTAMNNIKYSTYDGIDVPLTVANGGWTFSNTGYGVITSAEFQPRTGYTWRDMWMWRPDLFMATSAGEQVINTILSQQNHFNWENACSDAEAPVFATASGAVIDANSVRLTIQAADNWEGLLTYTIARAGAEPIISNHASGEEFTQDVTGLTTGTEYDFTVTVSDGVNNANTHILVTPAADSQKPVMGEASLASKTWNSAIINVAATDNIGVTAYYVVEKDAEYVAAEGKITVDALIAATEYTLHIKAEDAAGNISDNSAEVSFTTDAHLTEPQAACAAPTWPSSQVKAIYSPTYSADYNHQDWGGGTVYTQDTYGKKYVTKPAPQGYFGADGFSLNCLLMEKLHYDIWIADDATIRIVPIWEKAEGGQGAEQGVTISLTGQQWNSIDLDLAADYNLVTNWGNVYQMKIDQAYDLTFWIANAYFYRTSAIVDNEDPTNVSANLASAGFYSVKISAQAEDDSGSVNFSIKNGDTEVATGAASSGAATTITVNGLTPGTAYNFNVIASDDAGNKADPVPVVATTKTIPSPAPTPVFGNNNIVPVFTDAMACAVTGIQTGGWGESTSAQWMDIASGDKVFYCQNFNYAGWHSWGGGNIDATNMIYLHVDVYSLGMTSVQVTPISPGHEGSATINLTPNAWTSADVPLSEYATNNIEWNNIYQFKFMNAVGGDELMIDNVYFWQPAVKTTQDEDGTGWASFASAVNVEVPTGLNAYFAEYQKNSNEEVLYLHEITDGIIKAGEGVLLKGTGNTSFEFTSTTTEPTTDFTNNSLVGCTVRTDISSVAATNDIFCLRRSELFSTTAFFLYTGQYIPAGKAYLPIPKAGSSSAPDRKIRFVFDQATSVENTNAESVEATKFIENGQLFIRRGDAVYTIQGVRVK